MLNYKFWWLVTLGLPKSLYLNYYYFRYKGWKLPIIVTRRTRLKSVKGRVSVQEPISFGCVRIGFNEVALSSGNDWNVWNVQGSIEFNGNTELGSGTKLFVGSQGVLTIGDNFITTSRSEIACAHSVTFGDYVLISWDVLIMDTDAHPIRNANNQILNYDKPITIGNNVWIGARTMILKGTSISDDTIVAAGSTVNKAFSQKAIIIAGSPAKVVKDKIIWKREIF